MFEQLRRALGRPMPDEVAVDAEAQAILADIASLRPEMIGSLVDAFAGKITSEKLTGTVERLENLRAVPVAVRRYLAAREVPGPVSVSADPLLAGVDWSGVEVTSSIEAHRGAALGVARLAIAETGSIVMASSVHTPSLHNFLPLHHLVVVPVDRIRAYLEDVWQELDPKDHRLVSLITGTSGTADIEGRNVRGAHGPRFLHVLLIG